MRCRSRRNAEAARGEGLAPVDRADYHNIYDPPKRDLRRMGFSHNRTMARALDHVRGHASAPAAARPANRHW
jgi:hypothetical protein